MAREGYWVTRTYQAGRVWEKSKYFVPGTRPTGKNRRKQRDAIRKQEQNEYATVKALARLINANFDHEDLVMGLDYSEDGMEKILSWGRSHGLPVDSEDEAERMNAVWEAADHEMGNCLRRVQYRMKKQGMELKAAYITSDMNGETGETVRVHHHMVVNGASKEAFMDAWKELGGVDYTRMYENQDDRTPIAEYFIKQVRRIPDAKKFRSTRNLVRPKPEDRIALSDAEIRVPKGGKLLFRAAYGKGQPQYIRYVMPKTEPGGGMGKVCPGGGTP